MKHQHGQLEPAQPHRAPGGEQEDQHRDQVEREVHQRGQDDRHRHGQPRELDLAHQVLAVHQRGDGAAAGFAEEAEEHDPEQQRGREVRLFARRGQDRVAEDEVDDAEQQQRPHHLPQVAEGRAEEGELELRAGQRPGQVPEPARIGAEAPTGP